MLNYQRDPEGIPFIPPIEILGLQTETTPFCRGFIVVCVTSSNDNRALALRSLIGATAVVRWCLTGALGKLVTYEMLSARWAPRVMLDGL